MPISETAKQRIAMLRGRFRDEAQIEFVWEEPQPPFFSRLTRFIRKPKTQAEIDFAVAVDFARAAFAAAKIKYPNSVKLIEDSERGLLEVAHRTNAQNNLQLVYEYVEACIAISNAAKTVNAAANAAMAERDAIAAAAAARAKVERDARAASSGSTSTSSSATPPMPPNTQANEQIRAFFRGITAPIEFTVHQENGAVNKISDENVRALRTYADGDCGPHSVILSLLCEGMFLSQPRQLMARILYDMYNENKDAVRREGKALFDEQFRDFLIAYLQATDRGSIEAFARTYLTFPPGASPHPTMQFLTRCARAAARNYFIANKRAELGDEELNQFEGNRFTNLQYTHELLEQRYGLASDIPTTNIHVRADRASGDIRVHAGAIAEMRGGDHRIQWIHSGDQTDSGGHYEFRIDINEIAIPAPQDQRALIAELQHDNFAALNIGVGQAPPPPPSTPVTSPAAPSMPPARPAAVLPSGGSGGAPPSPPVTATIGASGPPSGPGFIATAYATFKTSVAPTRDSDYWIREENSDHKIFRQANPADVNSAYDQLVGTLYEMPPLEPTTPGAPSVVSELAHIDFDASKELNYYHAMKAFLEVSDRTIGPNNPARPEYKIRIPDLKTEEQARELFIAYCEIFKPDPSKPDPFEINYIRLEPTDAAKKAFYQFCDNDHNFDQWLHSHQQWLDSQGLDPSELKNMRTLFKVHMGFKVPPDQVHGHNQSFLAGYKPSRWFSPRI